MAAIERPFVVKLGQRIIPWPKPWVLIFAALLIMSPSLADYMTPKAASGYGTINLNLEEQIPIRFGDWTTISSGDIVTPRGRAFNRRSIYDQELKRAYRNKNGDIIMLLIAYGHDQSDALQMHRPEICYVASGFELLQEENADLLLPGSDDITIPAIYLETRRIQRFEPVTYWTRVGEDIPPGVVSLQVAKLWSGLMGRVPDGTLVRVSSLAQRRENHSDLHRNFIDQMLMATSPTLRPILVGRHAKPWTATLEQKKKNRLAEVDKIIKDN